jgi:hypothetical protein
VLIVKLRAEEIELRDRNSVLRSSNGGKTHVSQDFYRDDSRVILMISHSTRSSRLACLKRSGHSVKP